MNPVEKHHIHDLFLKKNYLELYQTQSATLNEMLLVNSWQEFEEYIENEDFLEEDIFWLYYVAVQGESLLIGGYEGDVTTKVSTFLKGHLPEMIFVGIQKYLQDIYVDMDDRDNLQEKTEICNQHLSDSGYFIHVDSEDIYCSLAYFLSVKHK